MAVLESSENPKARAKNAATEIPGAGHDVISLVGRTLRPAVPVPEPR